MKVIREMPDLFRLVGRLPINSYFVREDDGLTLVDANLPGRATRIVEIAMRLELPIRRIVLTHAHMDHTGSLDAPDGTPWSGTTVTVAFEPRGDKTLLVLVHENFPSVEQRDNAAGGWPGFLDRIEGLVAG